MLGTFPKDIFCLLKGDSDPGSFFCQTFAGAEEEGNIAETVCIDKEDSASKGFCLRVGSNIWFIQVAYIVLTIDATFCVLSTDKVALDFFVGLLFEMLENLDFLSANIRLPKASWLVHGQDREDLQGMVLNHILKGTRVIIVTTPILNPDGFCKADLNIVNEISVPNMFKNDIGKADSKNILDHFLA